MNIGLMYDAIDVIETLCDCIRDTPASCDACYLNEYPETCYNAYFVIFHNVILLYFI